MKKPIKFQLPEEKKRSAQNILSRRKNAQRCGCKTEVYSRVCGYFRPVSSWNKGKKEEWKDRKPYVINSQNLALRPKNVSSNWNRPESLPASAESDKSQAAPKSRGQ